MIDAVKGGIPDFVCEIRYIETVRVFEMRGAPVQGFLILCLSQSRVPSKLAAC